MFGVIRGWISGINHESHEKQERRKNRKARKDEDAKDAKKRQKRDSYGACLKSAHRARSLSTDEHRFILIKIKFISMSICG